MRRTSRPTGPCSPTRQLLRAHAIGNAYRFFLKHITALRDDGDLRTERLSTTIGDRLSLVFVTVNEGERPHKIFESINATGVGLSQSDLLRNYLFMALGQRSNNVYARYWRPLERALGTEGLEGLVRDNLQSSGEFVRQTRSTELRGASSNMAPGMV